MTLVARTIATAGGGTAVEVETPPTDDGDALLRALGVEAPLGTLIVNGSTATGESTDNGLRAAMAAVAAVAAADRFTVVTGATDAGIFAMLGSALTGATAPVIGVAPLGLVAWVGREADGGGEPLEGHHSHFVLVEGSRWGDETSTMMAVADALGRAAPVVAILCGGGAISRRELLGHVRAGRPVVVLAGSGRLADDLVAALDGGMPDDPVLAEVVEDGHLLVFPLGGGTEALSSMLRRLMATPPG